MYITKFGHSCLLIEEGAARLLIDPGGLSSGFEHLTELEAILITHHHQDHLVSEHIVALLRSNSRAKVYADEQSVEILAGKGVPAQAVHEGDALDISGVKVEVFGRDHMMIHPKIPRIRNVCYLVADRLFHPGDSHTVPSKPVEILALPIVAPWSNVGQTIDYVLAVKPKLVLPIHDAITGMTDMYGRMVTQVAGPEGIEYRSLRAGESVEL